VRFCLKWAILIDVMAATDKIFVYGTLRQGYSLHRHLRQVGAKYAGAGQIRGRLFDLGEYPGVLPSTRPSDSVRGELYDLESPRDQLSALDALEEYDPRRPRNSLFRRRIAEVRLDDGQKCKAWVYFFNRKPRSAQLIPQGDYSAFRRRRAVS
jgi:pyruvate carboxylase